MRRKALLEHIEQTPWLLALGSDEQAHHSFGIWEILVNSNLLNVLVLAMAIIYLGNKFLPKIVDEKGKQIKKELDEARQARLKAEEELELIKRKTENLSKEIEQINIEARQSAQIIKKQIEAEAEKDLEQLKQKVKREITSTNEEAVNDIKKSTSEAALKLAEESLSKVVKNYEIQKKLMQEFLSQVNSTSKN